MDEDRKAVADLRSERALYLITAALAVIAGQATVLTFILGARTDVLAFYFLLGVAFLSAVISITAGLRGIRAVTRAGGAGNWAGTIGRKAFNLQGGFLTLAFVVTAASPILAYATGSDRTSPLETAVSKEAIAVNAIASNYNALVKHDFHTQQAEIAKLSAASRHLRADMKALRARVTELATNEDPAPRAAK